MNSNEQIVVVGGGLSGLYLAYLLKKKGIDTLVLEASSRLGGRIQTIKGNLNTPLEIGATWFSDAHKNLLSLIDDVGLKKYRQFSTGISLFQTKSFEPPQHFYVPESENPSYRLKDGTNSLINIFLDALDESQIILNTKVVSITEINEKIELTTSDGRLYRAGKVVLCMPPQLVSSQVTFVPALPIVPLLDAVQTWMAGAIKFTLEYAHPFWRDNGYSGMLYSHSGIVSEMYDHTNFEGNKFGLTGFLNSNATGYSQKLRKELVLQQLVELMGEDANNPITYCDKVWNDEYIFDGPAVILRPHQNNGHPLLQRSYMSGKLFFCGTETSPIYGGYMEGAVISAKNTFNKL